MADPVPVTTITSAGALSPGFAAVLTSLQQNYQSVYGSDVDLDPDTQDGQLLAVFGTAVSDLNDLAVDVYNAFSPTTAQGNGLSSVVKINGLTREFATFSTVPVTCAGTANVQITNGTVTDAAGNVWSLPSPTVIGGGGTVTVTATCETAGAVALSNGVGLTISTPTPGWQSATTAGNAVAGDPVETDAKLRQRQSVSTDQTAQTVSDACLGAILNLPGVTRATFDDNNTGSADVNGVSAYSICFVVEGGDPVKIATTIRLKKSMGCGTFGSTTESTVDQYGIAQNISFDVLAYTQIYVTVSLTHLAGYVASTATMIQAVIVALVNAIPISQTSVATGLQIGPTVRYSKLWDAVNLSGDVAVSVTGLTQAQLDVLSATYDVTSLTVGTAPSPVGTANINVTWGSAPQTNGGQVSVS